MKRSKVIRRAAKKRYPIPEMPMNPSRGWIEHERLFIRMIQAFEAGADWADKHRPRRTK